MPETPSSASTRMRPDPLHFLLVEDDAVYGQLIERQFTDHAPHHCLTRVQDGTDALAYLHGEAPFEEADSVDLVLLDLNLPGLDGHELLERIKADPVQGPLPVVILTSSNAWVDRREAYRRHANSYLCKPTSFDAFGEMIQALVSYWGRFNQRPVIERRG